VFRRGTGCDACRGTGYFGRTAIYEMMVVTERIEQLIMSRAPGSAIKQAARVNGMKTLRANGLEKARAGITTVEEVLRVTQGDREPAVGGTGGPQIA
jgi:type II secretory ATPase GspE/PulE/Tfp pilus assembly ATPase PilB-like protein